MTDKELVEEYEKNAEYIEVDDYGYKVYGSIEIKNAFLAGLKAGKNANEGENYELRIKITALQELLTDSLFYCYHVDPYYIDCLKEDEIFERAEKLGVKYNV